MVFHNTHLVNVTKINVSLNQWLYFVFRQETLSSQHLVHLLVSLWKQQNVINQQMVNKCWKYWTVVNSMSSCTDYEQSH